TYIGKYTDGNPTQIDMSDPANLAAVDNATYAQGQYSETSGGGATGVFQGRRINDVSQDLKDGSVDPSQVDVEVVRSPEGSFKILSTRRVEALRRAGIPSIKWRVWDVTSSPKAKGDVATRIQKSGH